MSKPVIDQAFLRKFKTFERLGDKALEEIRRTTKIQDVPEGTVLFREGGYDNHAIFLLDGAVNFQSESGDEGTVMGGTPRADDALYDSRPRIVTATTTTNAQIMRVNSNVLGLVINKDILPKYDVREVKVDDMEEASNRMFFTVLQDLVNDRLNLPMLPDIAVKVREAVANDDSGPADVAKIIVADPSIAAKVIAIANSARFGGMAQVDCVQNAVSRLGLTNTRELVTSLTMRNIFGSKNADLKKRLHGVWSRSCKIAAIATVLARHTKGFSPDRALLAGLVNKIGVVPILTESENHPDLLTNPQHLEETIDQLHPQIGNTLLSRWNFPDDIAKAAMESENWFRNPQPKPDYADLLIVATIQSQVGTKTQNDVPRLYEVPASSKFDLGEITEEGGSRALIDLSAEIDQEIQTLTV